MAPGFSPYVPYRLPPEKPELDLRFRQGRPDPDLPSDAEERSRLAISRSCGCQSVPGYTGYLPSQRAECIYQGRQAVRGQLAEQSQAKHRERIEREIHEGTRRPSVDVASLESPLSRMNQSLTSTMSLASKSGSFSQAKDQDALDLDEARRSINMGRFSKNTMRHLPHLHREEPGVPDEHPLGKSMSQIQRHHSVPTIPGYGGYIPRKYSDNIHGSGIIGTCLKARRAIEEHIGPPEPQRERAPDPREDPESSARLAGKIQEHCERPIVGYMGYVPRVGSDSIFGARQTETHKLAAALCEDRHCGTPTVQHRNCPPRGPLPRKLRL